MKRIKHILAGAVLATASSYAIAQPQAIMASGNLQFINNIGKVVNVVVNENPNVGVPIKPEGLTINYILVGVICAANTEQCKTEFSVDGTNIGYAILNSKTGQLLDYQAYAPYSVSLDPNQVPLRTVTFNQQ